MNKFEDENDVLLEVERDIDIPKMHKVLLHNDNFTPMQFVIDVLISIFHKSQEDAERLMLDVHEKGVGLAGIYMPEVAEMKKNRVISIAQTNNYPLMVSVEEES